MSDVMVMLISHKVFLYRWCLCTSLLIFVYVLSFLCSISIIILCLDCVYLYCAFMFWLISYEPWYAFNCISSIHSLYIFLDILIPWFRSCSLVICDDVACYVNGGQCFLFLLVLRIFIYRHFLWSPLFLYIISCASYVSFFFFCSRLNTQ